jgi:FkbM family methyltransferase
LGIGNSHKPTFILKTRQMRFVAKIIKAVVPKTILSFLFPSKFIWGPEDRKFIRIKDSIAGKPFQMYLREDSMMERFFLSKGLYGEWERESLKIWAELSKKSKTIIDIGANTGVFSMVAQNNNPLAKVIAIEPIAINFEVLTMNRRQNNFPVHCENVALSDSTGTAKMFVLRDRLNYMASVNDNRYALHPEIQEGASIEEIEVPIKPFSYVNDKYKLENIDLIKIDVEGHEITVLNGMLPYIKKSRPLILIEVIGDDNADVIDKMFTNLGYRFVSIDEASKAVVVNKLWDNDHHNFLLCNDSTIEFLKKKGLIN